MSTNVNADNAELKATLNVQRKAALSRGGAFDHAGELRVQRMTDFDMSRTIFGGLTGIARKFMHEKLATEPVWDDAVAAEIEAAYAADQSANPAPPIDQRLIDFMVDECDFSMEHADGSFLEHLVFCHDYAARHYPDHSPNVALLHSILGTATNTFAMEAAKISQLEALLTEFEATQVQAFPSILRLLYDRDLLEELEHNIHRLDDLQALRCHRVIDNEPLTISADDLWINLNYHVMHFVDFMPVANWPAHQADPLLQMFEALVSLLDSAGRRQAHVQVAFPDTKTAPIGETRTLFGRITGLLPASVTRKLARKSIQEYSDKAGHDLSYQLDWRD